MENAKALVVEFIEKFKFVGTQMTRHGGINVKKYLLITLPLIILSLITGCGDSQATSVEIREAAQVKNSVTIQINGKNFSATLEDNPTARACAERLPLEVDMTELNGNEKYFYLNADLAKILGAGNVRVKFATNTI